MPPCGESERSFLFAFVLAVKHRFSRRRKLQQDPCFNATGDITASSGIQSECRVLKPRNFCELVTLSETQVSDDFQIRPSHPCSLPWPTVTVIPAEESALREHHRFHIRKRLDLNEPKWHCVIQVHHPLRINALNLDHGSLETWP